MKNSDFGIQRGEERIMNEELRMKKKVEFGILRGEERIVNLEL